jgi:hypothetical protein
VSVVWEDPPFVNTSDGSRTNWVEVLEPLMQDPGRWARVGEKVTRSRASSLANSLRRGASKGKGGGYNYVNVPPGRWEFVSRTVHDEDYEPHYYVYARYLGEEEG